ncbi:Csu type fimbrial protein [Roseateles amylovorans]|jgi:spore coat protein U-like protein|uniref:Spore coat U domain-containing protein n=1 Tax=Roseateles amylovorans TaxID=2978473 RepID=A0ABY6B2V9_9BURK|nr:spore coat U domain-containing protein [Roseateles amylovorans]UXH79559.1 spore coat U domain-containing protein [Roseateles amylovorans]
MSSSVRIHAQSIRASLAALALMATASITAAAPATSSGTLEIGATILVACNVSGSTLNFGTAIDPLQTPGPVDALTSLAVTCTRTTPYSVALSAGANAGNASAFGNRAMKSGANSLPYQLYLDAGRTQVWGDGNSSGVFTGTGTGSQQMLTVYGRLPSLNGIPPGNYSDTVTLTITY